jgi:hypothetical protein
VEESPDEPAVGIRIEVAILQQQGEFVWPAREAQRLLFVVADNITCQ